MIVVAIIGILAAIAQSFYGQYVAKVQATRAVVEAASLKMPIELCLTNGDLKVGEDCILPTLFSHVFRNDQLQVTNPLILETKITGVLGEGSSTALVGRKIVWQRDATGN